jgi:hypothetical protein
MYLDITSELHVYRSGRKNLCTLLAFDAYAKGKLQKWNQKLARVALVRLAGVATGTIFRGSVWPQKLNMTAIFHERYS